MQVNWQCPVAALSGLKRGTSTHSEPTVATLIVQDLKVYMPSKQELDDSWMEYCSGSLRKEYAEWEKVARRAQEQVTKKANHERDSDEEPKPKKLGKMTKAAYSKNFDKIQKKNNAA
ncbi:MAG: hypothetical protein Q9187_005285 [Circinaria calcarea]